MAAVSDSGPSLTVMMQASRSWAYSSSIRVCSVCRGRLMQNSRSLPPMVAMEVQRVLPRLIDHAHAAQQSAQIGAQVHRPALTGPLAVYVDLGGKLQPGAYILQPVGTVDRQRLFDVQVSAWARLSNTEESESSSLFKSSNFSKAVIRYFSSF